MVIVHCITAGTDRLAHLPRPELQRSWEANEEYRSREQRQKRSIRDAGEYYEQHHERKEENVESNEVGSHVTSLLRVCPGFDNDDHNDEEFVEELEESIQSTADDEELDRRGKLMPYRASHREVQG